MLLGTCLAASLLSAYVPAKEETSEAQSAAPEKVAEDMAAFTDGYFTCTQKQDGSLRLTDYSGEETDPVIPAEINGLPVTEIGEGCFQGNLSIEKVHIPEGIQSIGDYAFECCSSLKKVYCPDSLLFLGDGAFSGCNHLILADLQDNLETIGKGAFLCCTGLISLDLPAKLAALGEFAFADCSGLARVTFNGGSLTAIPERLFYGCSGLLSVNVPSVVTSVGERAFADCTSLSSLYFAAPLEELGEYAFAHCEALSNINFSSNELPKGILSGCTSLKWFSVAEGTKALRAGAFENTFMDSVSLPADIEVIEEGAFANSAMTSLSFDGNDTYSMIDGSLYTDGGKTLLAYFPADPYAEEPATSFAVPEGVEVIGASAFSFSQLSSLTLPSTLKEVHSLAFADSSLEGLDIPESVTVAPDAYGKNTSSAEGDEPVAEETQEAASEPAEEAAGADQTGSFAPESSLFSQEAFQNFIEVRNEDFSDWSQKYLDCNKEALLDQEKMPYIMMYKGEVVPHFKAMTCVLDHDPSMWADAENLFGAGFEDMYLMMDHGLFTELRRGKMCDSLILYSGVYDSQLIAAAGTEVLPTREQLAASIGRVFSDPLMISTTTDPIVACGFSDTLFIIYASKEAMESLGAISIDSFIGTNEKEILMCPNAQYKVLDVGSMEFTDNSEGSSGEKLRRNYVKVELLGPAF